MRRSAPTTVLVLQRSILKRDREELSGISSYARRARWALQTVEYGNAVASRFHGAADGGALDVRSIVAFWRPSGIVVECGGEPPGIPPEAFGGASVVYMDSPPDAGGPGAVRVVSDPQSIAACAAHELLAPGVSDCAVVEWPKDTDWSRERHEAFRALAERGGVRVRAFSAPGLGQAEWRGRLAAFLESLPRPCGLFAVNDWCAAQAVDICVSLGISVPADVSVVGVDDDEDLCEGAPVAISSVKTDNVRAGALAAELLDSMMSGGAVPASPVSFGALGLVRRASSRRLAVADAKVVRALEHIRLHACEGLEAGDVAAAMGCSRRWAEMRFRAVTGRTILDEIRDVRHAKAVRLLEGGVLPVAAVAQACGWDSESHFRKTFRERAGMSPRQWRALRA